MTLWDASLNFGLHDFHQPNNFTLALKILFMLWDTSINFALHDSHPTNAFNLSPVRTNSIKNYKYVAITI